MEHNKEEVLNTFHWHRWVASRKGSVTISAEDMDLYCVLINKLIANVGAQDMTISELRKLLEKANHDADRYARKIKELTEENERLRAELEQRPPKLIITKLLKKENENV